MPDLIDVRKGSEVLYQGRQATIDRHVSLEQALIKFEDGSFETVRLSALGKKSTPAEIQSLNEIPLEVYSEQNIDLAKKRLAVIQPILDDPANKSALVREASERTGFALSTIYRWLKKHEISPRLTSHISKASRKRKKRLCPRVERIIEDVITELYLKPKRVSQLRVIEEVKARCKSARLKAPHPNTIRSRINELSEKVKVKGRRGAKKARERHDAIKGKFPEGQLPLQCVQMDTQELHVHIVDSEERLEIGRPYLTLAVDTFSRMIVGYHLSLDAASAFTAGACVYHMLLPKDKTLERLGVEGSWPVWGLPGNLHVDNGKDFRSKSLQRACEKHHITIEFRPPNFPNWAGCVESFFDSLNHWVHDLDGTTKSNPLDRGDYNAIKNSNMTMDELEEWLITFIVAVYHNRNHSVTEVPPIERWRDGIEGRNGYVGIGQQPIPADTRDLRLDFLPSTERTVGKYGIRWSKIYYYSDVLDRWVNEKQGGTSVKHIVRRDPHDISKLYFFDPEIEKYFEIPYSNIAHPTIDKWELERAQEHLAKRGLKKSEQDEDAIFDGVRKMRQIENESREKTAKSTRKQRKKAEKKRKHAPAPMQQNLNDQTQLAAETTNVTDLTSRQRPKRFSFGGNKKTEVVTDDDEHDYGEWS
jgi:putative transposase